MYCLISHEKACLYQFGGRPVQCGLRACADRSGRAYRQIVYIALSPTGSALARTDLSPLTNGIWKIHAGCSCFLHLQLLAKIG